MRPIRRTSPVLVALAVPCLGQSRPLEEHPRVQEALALLDAWVEGQRAYEGIPGTSMAVVHDQAIIWTKAYGYADRERRAPATTATVYSICSISKLFTSIGVMQLRDRGALRLDDPAAKHLTWFRIGDRYPDAPPVTVEGVLTHASGLPRESDHPYWTGPDFPFPTREQIIERLASQEELYPAFTVFQYSNLGLTLAGEIVMAASGESFDRYIRANILDPLAMRDTHTDIPPDDAGGRLATGYSARTREGTREPLPRFRARGIAPAAGFASTVEDLARFAMWQFRVLDGAHEVLAPNTLREMHRVHWLDPDWETTWGLGFAVSRRDGKTFVGHGGSCPGFRSQLALQPEERIAVVFMANASGVNTASYVNGAWAIVAPAVAEAKDTTRAATPTDPAFARYMGTYDAQPWGGETVVVPWKGGLAALALPTTDPMDGLTELRHVGEHTFRRVRKDKSLGETLVFEVGPDGRVTRLWRHSNYDLKVQ